MNILWTVLKFIGLAALAYLNPSAALCWDDDDDEDEGDDDE